MSYNVKELLVLSAEEKIVLADLLYSSVNKELETNKGVSDWCEDDHFVDELNKEYEAWEQGRTKGYALEEVKEFMKEQKANRKSHQ